MSKSELDEAWSRIAGDVPPIAHWLRYDFADRWVRFHSLPRGKRYAESPAEVSEILRRHNAVLDELARASERVFLVTSAYTRSALRATRPACLKQVDETARKWRVLAMHEVDPATDSDEPYYLHQFSSSWLWRRGLFDPHLRLVADEKVHNVMFVFPDDGGIYHPYDGGADVVLRDTPRRDAIAAKYRAWRSRNASGL